jgi:hypothetical protein
MLGIGRKGHRKASEARDRKAVRLGAERLDDRAMPVVAAFNVPEALTPSKNWAGIVSILQNPDDVGGATGTLLPSGQHILTAAHVIDANGDKTPDAPYYYVNFDLPGKRVQMVVPSNRIAINPQWQGATDDGFKNGHDTSVMQLSGIAPWGNGPGRLTFDLYSGATIPTGGSSPANQMNIVGYGYVGDGYIGQNSSPNVSQISSTVQTLMLPPTASGSFSLRNPKTSKSIRLNANGLTADVVEKAVEGLDPTGFTDVQVVQRLQKGDPYFGSFDIVFRQVDTARYAYGDVPALQFRRQSGFRTGSQGAKYRTGLNRSAFPTLLGTKQNASTYFNVTPEDMSNVFVTQLNASPRLAIIGQGDSGGPALFKRKIAGVASFYTGDSEFGQYGGWSDVTKDAAWINANSASGGTLIVDMATQPVTIGNETDYVTVAFNSTNSNMQVLVHGRTIYKAPSAGIESVQIVSRGVPLQFRTVGKPPFDVKNVPNSQKGLIKTVERVNVIGQTTTSPAVVISSNLLRTSHVPSAKQSGTTVSRIVDSVSEMTSSAISTVRDKATAFVTRARKSLS